MKNERGVTITSIMIYIIVLTIVVIILGRISTYFYTNVKELDNKGSAGIQYTKFSTFITDEINTPQNEIESYGENYIKFSKTQNQYTFKNGNIYLNKAKICKNVDNCKFIYNAEENTVYVYFIVDHITYQNRYCI